VECSIVWTLS